MCLVCMALLVRDLTLNMSSFLYNKIVKQNEHPFSLLQSEVKSALNRPFPAFYCHCHKEEAAVRPCNSGYEHNVEQEGLERL